MLWVPTAVDVYQAMSVTGKVIVMVKLNLKDKKYWSSLLTLTDTELEQRGGVGVVFFLALSAFVPSEIFFFTSNKKVPGRL